MTPSAPTAKASVGDSRAGTATFSTTPSPLTASAPWAKNTAPTTQPSRACDELEGSPTYQVAMFHAMAPMSPAKTVVVVTAPESTSPLATVAATSSDRKAPAKLRTAAPATAIFGAIARVEIEVATTLAVS